MNRGPEIGAVQPDRMTMTEKSAAAYNTLPPDWVSELARLVDQHGLKKAAQRIGYSTSAISTVINNKYAGDVSKVEQSVRGALMGETVECPVLGAIGRDRCLHEQKQGFRATSAHRAQLFHACRGGCPNALLKGDGNDQR